MFPFQALWFKNGEVSLWTRNAKRIQYKRGGGRNLEGEAEAGKLRPAAVGFGGWACWTPGPVGRPAGTARSFPTC